MSSCLLLTAKFRFLWDDDFFLFLLHACYLNQPNKNKTKQNSKKKHIPAEIRNVTNKYQHCVPYLKSIPACVDQ